MSLSSASSEYAHRCAVFKLVPLLFIQVAVESQLQHAQQSVHGRAQFVRHVGQEFALGLAGGQRRVLGELQFAGAFVDALLEQLVMLANFLARSSQSLDHPVEALAQVLDLVAGPAHLNGPELPFSHRGDPGFQQFQRPRQSANGEAGDREGDEGYNGAQDHALLPTEGPLQDVDRQGDYPKEKYPRENRELRRQRLKLWALFHFHIFMVGCFSLGDHRADTLIALPENPENLRPGSYLD